jgi:ABC-2 type transport system ATP-binding protein
MKALEIDHVSKAYRSRRDEVRALEGVSFSLEEGQMVGLLGANGAGKTTLIKCASSLIEPDDGHIRIHGADVVADRRAAAAQVSAVLEGSRNLFWRLTVRENLYFFAALQGVSRRDGKADAERLIQRFGLGDKGDVQARKLSRGMQQKLAVACALVRRAPLLLLDEPTLGLDVPTATEFREHLRELTRDDGRTIVLSSHDMRFVEATCERVVIIHGGRVVGDDAVESLRDLFPASGYRFRFARIDEHAATVVAAAFPGGELEREGDDVVLTLDVMKPSQLYDVLDAAKAVGLVPLSFSTDMPDLERVFLRSTTEREI